MSSYALVCTVEPVGGVCPTGSEAWVDVSSFSAFYELSPSEVSSLMVPAVGVLVLAWCLKLVRRQFVNV